MTQIHTEKTTNILVCIFFVTICVSYPRYSDIWNVSFVSLIYN